MNTPKQLKCTECHRIKCTSGTRCCSSCRKPLCAECISANHARATRDKFYASYRNYCDACIWFDIG